MDENETLSPLPTLPMHLMMSMGCLLSSPFAWQCVNGDWPPSKQNKSQPQSARSKSLREAIAKEAKNRASDLLSGVLRYVEDDYARKVPEKPAIWRRGNARLLDYGIDACSSKTGFHSVVLFIPSLINRYYILDLEEERSLLRYLASQGIYPLVLDWGAPGKFEKSFGCDEYITKILLEAIDFVHGAIGQRVCLAGYCMGGVLALAAAKLRLKKVSSLALLATPWDFHCKAFSPFIVEKKWLPMLSSTLLSEKTVPASVIQSLFYMTDPWVFEHKFRRFSSLAGGSREARDFIALERWVNDGVPMTAKLAKECLIDWAQNNMLAKGEWAIGKQKIVPKGLKMPVFIAIPKSDHVVPHDCAQPLANAFPNAEIINPGAGHVGMMVGSNASKEFWQPFARWIKNLK